MKPSIIGASLSLLIATTLLSGCSDENSNAINNALGGAQILSKSYGQAVTVSGVISNTDGSIDHATLKVTDQSGQTLLTTHGSTAVVSMKFLA